MKAHNENNRKNYNHEINTHNHRSKAKNLTAQMKGIKHVPNNFLKMIKSVYSTNCLEHKNCCLTTTHINTKHDH